MKQLLLEKISLLSSIFPETFFCDHEYIYKVPNNNVYLIKRPISQPRNIANILFSTRTLCLDCTFKIKTMVNMCKLQQAQFATRVICNTCNLQHVQFATSVTCNTCQFYHVQHA